MATQIPSPEDPLPPVSIFGVRATEEVYVYLSRIAEAMTREFGVPASEAHLRVDRHFRPYDREFVEEDDLDALFRYDAEYWAGTIYFRPDSWRQDHAADWSRLRPRTLPEPGDPAFGGLALGDHPPQIVYYVPWDGELDVLASAVAGSRQCTSGRSARLENDRMAISFGPGLTERDEAHVWEVECEPEPDASWQDVSADLRAITFRLRAAGLVCKRVALRGRGGPVEILD
ncbi:hypothetical protein [Embleya sp. NPDC005575]|uniref:hypothetical protein n=1 Tax=Embleya sp. NPDC005575 TaxID=3156892 RepID=UPI0033B77A76